MTSWIGKPQPRNEDRRLVIGKGCYTDDIEKPGQAWAALEIAAHKQRGQVVAPRVLASAIHAALNDLCLALLHPDPTARPAPAEILRALEDGPPAAPVPPSTPCPAIFVGRNHELGVLARALEDTRQGRPVIVLTSAWKRRGLRLLALRLAQRSGPHPIAFLTVFEVSTVLDGQGHHAMPQL